MLRFLKGFFSKTTPPAATPEQAPYKVEAPVEAAPAKCGCGRSSTGLCVGLHKLTAEEWAGHADNTAKVAPAKKPAVVAKAAVQAKKAAAKKAPAAMKAPAKPKATKKPKAK